MQQDELIASITQRLREKQAYHTDVYKSEPILFRASGMGSYLPDVYRQMKEIGRQKPHLTDGELFIEQVRFMAEVEDDCPCQTPFSEPYPTYQRLTGPLLRGYFTWRTKVRKSTFEPVQLSFIFLYFYEQLILAVDGDAATAYDALEAVWQAYSTTYPMLDTYAIQWLDDLCLHYGLSRPIRSVEYTRPLDAAITVLRDAADYDDEAVFAAMCMASLYQPPPDPPKATAFVAAHVWRQLCEHIGRQCKTSLLERFFGPAVACPRILFLGTVLCAHEWDTLPDRETQATPLSVFRRQNGRWTQHSACAGKSSKELTRLLKAIEACLSENEHIPTCPKNQLAMIRRAIHAYEEEQARLERTTLHIDRSRFSAIRTMADATCDRLLTEDERTPDDPTPPATPPPCETASPFSPAQEAILAVLLDGGDAVACAKKYRCLLSVEIEAINEQLMEDFGEPVIDWDGDTPYIYPDYLNDLKGRFR